MTRFNTPSTEVCAIYRTPLGRYENLIRSDLFSYSSRVNWHAYHIATCTCTMIPFTAALPYICHCHNVVY